MEIQNDAITFAKLEGRMEGLQEGRQEGRQEGKQEAIYTIASNAKKQGLSSEIISGLTGLSIEEIDSI